MRDLPTGTVTFLFTDVEGSTRLLQELGDRYAEVLAEHRRVLREAFARHGGVEVDTQGDAFFFAFATASEALAAAAEAHEALAVGPVRVRIGLHTGEPLVTHEGYVGIDVHRAARIAAAGHGGQILVSESTRDLAGANGLRDLGEHRLKDLTAPERIYQLGAGEFPPLKSLNQTNLPVQPTPLVGRERELREVLELISSHRLVTLTGPGGSGKTRLGLQAAAEFVEAYPDGVWFVSLSPVRDPSLIEPSIAQIVGARDELHAFLRNKKLLLLLDNLEQLLPDAGPLVASMNAHVLATSRERLNVAGEQEYPVPTLPPGEAVTLFTERARQLQPSFEPNEYVAEITRRLDGLPLALELAAARIKVLTPQQILERLGHSLDLLTAGSQDAPERQRTLRATIGWSHELLDEAERVLFARAAVFAGSFDVEAIEVVCEADLDMLASLVDKSLLRRTEQGRFFMLETIREFAHERLTALNDDERVRDRHARHYLRVVERVKADARVVDASEAYAILDAEHDNIRISLSFFEEARAVEEEFRLIEGLAGFWFVRGHLAEGYRRVEEALRCADEAPPRLRAEVLAIASDLARALVGPDVATTYAERSLSVAREIGDPQVLARALHELGESVQAQGDYVRAKALFREAIAATKLTGRSGAASIANLGDVALMEGDFAEAVARSTEAAELLAAEGSTELIVPQFNLASALFHLGRLDEARTPLGQALRAACDVGYNEAVAWCLLGAAALLARTGRVADAGRLLCSAEAILDEIGSPLGASEQRLHDVVTGALAAQSLSPGETGPPLGREEAVALARQCLG